MGIPFTERLALLEANYNVMSQRDDLYTIYLSYLNRQSRSQEVLDALKSRIFHPWEGGEGKVTKEYVTACKDMALSCMDAGDWQAALSILDQAMTYPHNLGEGKLEGCKDNEIHYMKGLCLDRLSQPAEARAEYTLTLEGRAELGSAMYYYDQSADVIAFQAMALSRLERADEAREKFSSLVRHGQEHRNDSVGFDYFAVSLPDLQMWTDDLSLKNRAHCCYIMALGQYGLGNADEAEKDFTEALSINPDLVDAERLHRIIGKLF